MIRSGSNPAVRRVIAAVTLGTFLGAGASAAGAPPAPGQHASALDERIDRLRSLAAESQSAADGETLGTLAEAVLERLSLDGTDTTALFGVLDSAQRPAVQRLAREAFDAAERSAAALEAQIAALEADSAFADSRELQDRRSRLAVEWLEMRLPLALGRAAAILGASERSPEVRAQLARRAALAVNGVAFDTPALQAERLVILGVARLLGAEDAGDPPRTRPAADPFDAALSLPSDEPLWVIAPRACAEASLGRALAIVAAQGPAVARSALAQALVRPPFLGPDGRPDALLQLVATDVQFRIALSEAQAAPEGESRRRAVDGAFGAYAALLSREQGAMPYNARRNLVFAKVRSVNIPGDPSGWPPIAAIARARSLALEERTREDAIRLLRGLAERPDLGALEPERLWELAQAHLCSPLCGSLTGGEDAGAVAAARSPALKALVALAERFPEWPLWAQAVERACRLGEIELANDATVAPALADVSSRLGPEHERALRLAVSRPREIASIDLWRIRLARKAPFEESLVLLRSVGPDRVLERFEASRLIAARLAATLPGSVAGPPPPDGGATRESARAVLQAVADAREAHVAASANFPQRTREPIADLCDAEVAALLAIGDLDAALDAALHPKGIHESGSAALVRFGDAICLRLESSMMDRESAEEAARLGSMLDAAVDAQRPPRDQRHEAFAALTTGRPREAVALLDSLAAGGQAGDGVLLARAEALLASDDPAAAFAAFRDLAASLERKSPPGRVFWRSWRRMLEILESNNADGARSATIRREIARLRSLDATLGSGLGDGRDGRLIEAIEKRIGAE